MPIIEFIGIPRAGKTTTAKYLEKNFPDITYYPERHDLVPVELKNDEFGYNYWYAKYCVNKLLEVTDMPGTHIFERGVIDHIIIGKAYFKMGWFTKEQLQKYLEILNPHINKINKVFVFKIPVEVSVERAKEMGKDVSKAIPYISTLYKEYSELGRSLSNAISLPEDASLSDLKKLTVKYIKKQI